MRKYIFLLTGILFHSLFVRSQSLDISVVAAAGNSDKNASYLLDWTMGEYAVETIVTQGKMYTQGFHQPITITATAATNTSARTTADGIQYNVSVGPNPTTSIINFGITSTRSSKVFVVVSDVKGYIFLQKLVYTNTGSIQIDLSALPAGSYSLTVRSSVSANVIKSYTIIKG